MKNRNKIGKSYSETETKNCEEADVGDVGCLTHRTIQNNLGRGEGKINKS